MTKERKKLSISNRDESSFLSSLFVRVRKVIFICEIGKLNRMKIGIENISENFIIFAIHRKEIQFLTDFCFESSFFNSLDDEWKNYFRDCQFLN